MGQNAYQNAADKGWKELQTLMHEKKVAMSETTARKYAFMVNTEE